MEAIGWILVPGKIIQTRVTDSWERYIHLVDVESRNKQLLEKNKYLQMQVARLSSQALELGRIKQLLAFAPPPTWQAVGARVIGHQFGPQAALQTILIDQGSTVGVFRDTPVVAPGGVIGRTYRYSFNFATVLLLTDPNINIPVISAVSRIPAILKGGGAGHELIVDYVPLNSALLEKETLLTSGLAGIFPKGLPVARVSSIVRSDISLFQEVYARPFVNPAVQEEVLVLIRPKKSRSGYEGSYRGQVP